jgi:hypothetical protein
MGYKFKCVLLIDKLLNRNIKFCSIEFYYENDVGCRYDHRVDGSDFMQYSSKDDYYYKSYCLNNNQIIDFGN